MRLGGAPVDAYPLAWPPGWRRTPSSSRKRAKFNVKVRKKSEYSDNVYTTGQQLSIDQATMRVIHALHTLGARQGNIIISSNLQLRNDGLPRSGQRNPDDPGVAVYWQRQGEHQRCMAVDRYDRVADNLAAIAATLDAMRAIERHGGATILDRAFTGFTALPAPEQWFEVLGVSSHANVEQINSAWRKLASENHPDKGGDADQMARINRARDEGLERVSPGR